MTGDISSKSSHSEANSLAATHGSPAFLELDANGIIVSLNEKLIDLFDVGRERAEILGENYQSLFVHLPTYSCALIDSLVEFRLDGKVGHYQEEIKFPSGETVTVSYVDVDREGEQRHVWLFVDVTVKKRQEDQLRFQANLLSKVKDAVITVDSEMITLFWNEGAELLTGIPAREAVGKRPDAMIKYKFPSKKEEQAARDLLMGTGAWTGEVLVQVPAHEEVRHVHAAVNTLHDSNGAFEGVLVVVRDETERKQMQTQLIHQAHHDALTDLPNRKLLVRAVDSILKSGVRDGYALLFLDLDRFKMINDSLGHLVGDKLLIEIGRRLTDCLRPSDMVSRLGGDEFAILLRRINGSKEAIEVAERILKTFERPFDLDGTEVFTGASVGIVLGSAEYSSAENLLQDADTAMYQAKQGGRSCYEIFDQSQQIKVTEKLRIETNLRKALTNGELVPYYQPIVDIQRGELVGFESLIRWKHPTKGVMAPDYFVGVAEESDLIAELDLWLWQESIKHLAEWNSVLPEPERVFLSVNCSNRTFHLPHLDDRLANLLEDAGVDGQHLSLEVTEGVIITDIDAATKLLGEIRRNGTRISIDDFGTGYASLSVLQTLPIDSLKIDQSFVRELEQSERKEDMLRSIVDLSRSLSLSCIAEGIESRRQLAILRSMKCKYGQGYLFAKPMDAEMVNILIDTRQDWLQTLFPSSITGNLKIVKRGLGS